MNGKTIFINSRSTPISNFPEMNFGNMAADGGRLLFTTPEKNEFVRNEPNSAKYFKQLLSAEEFLNGKDRWCLWLENITDSDLKMLPNIQKRINEVKIIRQNSSRPQLASIPHLFAQITQPPENQFILIPRVSSEKRPYIPTGIFNKDIVSADSCQTIVTNDLSIFGIVSSRMHMVWVRAVGGKLEDRLRYSKNVIYNTFPFPEISDEYRSKITQCVFRIIAEREEFSERTLAMLYDPAKMPEGLRTAHRSLDEVIDRCYLDNLKEFRGRSGFESDGERLEMLFGLYEVMSKKVESKIKKEM